MTKKSGKELYEPPIIINLSAFSANGQGVQPLGNCEAGPSPHYSCVIGSGFVGVCTPGTTPDVSLCEEGGVHTDPSCDTGGMATTRCWSGSGQNF